MSGCQETGLGTLCAHTLVPTWWTFRKRERSLWAAAVTFRTTSINQAWNSERKVQVWTSNLAFASDEMSSLNWGNAGLWESLRVFMLPQLRHHAASFPLISKTVSTFFRQRWGWSGKIGETWRAREFMLALLSAGNTWKPDGTWRSLLSDNGSTAEHLAVLRRCLIPLLWPCPVLTLLIPSFLLRGSLSNTPLSCWTVSVLCYVLSMGSLFIHTWRTQAHFVLRHRRLDMIDWYLC